MENKFDAIFKRRKNHRKIFIKNDQLKIVQKSKNNMKLKLMHTSERKPEILKSTNMFYSLSKTKVIGGFD